MTPPLPAQTWQVIDLLRSRVPELVWNPGRVALALLDHPAPDAVAVAGRCADWIVFQAARVSDGPATFRTFLERASREQPPSSGPVLAPSTRSADLSVYDRFAN